ncbi:hypothetical protein BHE74_00028109 [Ensete ventricosum]|nr:hypothetical protein BHE74_00028109 [Ensete ventricosum]RZR93680.1 hypothetical protein BHM03_00022246 [Ensete ventricosum]
MQRFDPGFGFNSGPGAIHPLYSPAVNYNTEFPQLGSGHGAQFPVDHQPQPIPHHLHGPWLSPSAPNVINYGPPAGMMPTYNSNHVHAHSTTSVYMHSSQYSVPPHPGMSFAHPNGHIQSFAQVLFLFSSCHFFYTSLFSIFFNLIDNLHICFYQCMGSDDVKLVSLSCLCNFFNTM